MVAISAIGLSYFGSAIAEEKEEQTLGLLRMTDLSPLSILLGKSTSRLCGALLLLAAAFPFTIFAVTLGGISLGQIVATYCTIGAYTFLLCNVALLGSVLARQTAGAAIFTAMVIGGASRDRPASLEDGGHYVQKFGIFWGLSPVADTSLGRRHRSDGSQTSLPRAIRIAPAGWQVATNLALGAVSFLLAWAAFERFCERTSEAAGARHGKFMRVFGMRIPRPPRPKSTRSGGRTIISSAAAIRASSSACWAI